MKAMKNVFIRGYFELGKNTSRSLQRLGLMGVIDLYRRHTGHRPIVFDGIVDLRDFQLVFAHKLFDDG